MSGVSVKRLGSIAVLDLDVISRHHGRDFLPYPFVITQSLGPEDTFAYRTRVSDALERFEHGDLRWLQHWAGTYIRADVTVEAHVQFIPPDAPNVRVVAHRFAEFGYLATQLPDTDEIEVYSLSQYDLGSAVAGRMQLGRPGKHPAIVIPEYRPASTESAPALDRILAPLPVVEGGVRVPRTDVRAFATVQTRLRPTRKWGLDPSRPVVLWVRIDDDGDYLYSPDFTAANPVTRQKLTDRIDRLIADDVRLLRDARRDR